MAYGNTPPPATLNVASAAERAPCISGAIDGFGRSDDHAKMLVDRMRALRDSLTGGSLEKGQTPAVPPTPSPHVPRAYAIYGSLNTQLNLLDSLITEVQQALG